MKMAVGPAVTFPWLLPWLQKALLHSVKLFLTSCLGNGNLQKNSEHRGPAFLLQRVAGMHVVGGTGSPIAGT